MENSKTKPLRAVPLEDVKPNVQARDDEATCSSSSVENAVVAMIRSRGKVGRRKYRTTMDRKDLHPDEWVQHYQEELADALQYAERMKGMAELLHTARDIMLTLLHEREWECASEWVDRYHAQFRPTNDTAQIRAAINL